MRIKTLTRACGRLSWQPGQTVDIDAGEARELIRLGLATAVDAAPQPPPPAATMAAPATEPAAKPAKAAGRKAKRHR